MAATEQTGRVAERRRAILEAALTGERINVGALARRLGVSEVTVRRDLEQLARAGLLRRVHGGAQAVGRPGQLSVFEARLLQNVEVKRALGRAAAALVRPGEVIFLDSGTTVLEIARHLPEVLLEEGGLTVVTRSLVIAGELRRFRRTRLIVVGGLYVHDYDDFVGAQAEGALAEIHADTLFIGTDGVTAGRGLTTDNVPEASLYRVMARRAGRVAVVTDSSKIGVNKVQATLDLDEVAVFITDDGAPADFVALLRERGCQVILVPRP